MYTAGTARTNAYFGSGTGHIYMNDVTCITSKTSLLQCTSDPLLSGGCSHSQDAGVECEGKLLFSCQIDQYMISIMIIEWLAPKNFFLLILHYQIMPITQRLLYAWRLGFCCSVVDLFSSIIITNHMCLLAIINLKFIYSSLF